MKLERVGPIIALCILLCVGYVWYASGLKSEKKRKMEWAESCKKDIFSSNPDVTAESFLTSKYWEGMCLFLKTKMDAQIARLLIDQASNSLAIRKGYKNFNEYMNAIEKAADANMLLYLDCLNKKETTDPSLDCMKSPKIPMDRFE